MAKVGHNSKVQAGPVNAERLKSFVERIERLEEERKAIGGDIRDIYTEAKGVGYDVKTVRWVVQERRVDASDRAERDTLRDVYQHALDTAVGLVRGGLSLREAGRVTGTSKSSIHRALAVPDVSQPASHDGEITETEESCGGRGVEASAHDNPAPRGLAPSVGAGHDQQTQTVAVRRDRAAPDVGNVAEPEVARESALRSPPPQDAYDDMPDQPQFLRGAGA